MRLPILKQSAAAAALACLFIGADAFASDPVPPAAAAPAAQAAAEASTLGSAFSRLGSSDPLFLVELGQNGPADDAANGANGMNGMMDPCDDPDYVWMGVLKDPRRGIFGVNSKEGDAILRLGAMGQFRHSVSYFEPFGGGDKEFENGFEFARLHTFASGRFSAPDIEYFVLMDWADGGGTLQDAYVVWRSNGRWGIRAGQFKNPISQEWLVYSGNLLASDRSLAHALMTGDDRVQGISLLFAPSDTMRGEVAFHDGFGSSNTQFLNSNTHAGVSARLEMLLKGMWKNYKNFSAHGTEGQFFAVGVGGGMSWNDGDDRLGRLTADLTWKQDNLSVFAAVFANPNSTAGNDTLDLGAIAQVGFLANENLEPFGRVSIVKFDDDLFGPGAEDTFFEVTGGVNFYPWEAHRNRVKFTVDVGVLPNGSPADLAQQGYIATDELEIVGRGQAQIRL